VRITPQGVPAFSKLEMPFGRLNRVVLGLAGGMLYRYDTYPGELFLEPPRLDGIGDWPALPGGVKVPKLTPVKEVVTVTPGQLATVPVDFRVPPAPNPLDVYFLLDTTGSMQPAIDGLKASISTIAAKMRKALGKQACFGLGEFRDFYPGDTQHTYNRDLPITCDSPVEKIQKYMADVMRPAAGGSDIPEAQTIALTQAVTGKGEQLPAPPVAPGQQAGFRADAYKIIVLISDSSFSHRTSDYPTKEVAINTLNVADVKAVSVLVTTGEGDHDNALADMQELAAGTNTLAPAQGVDCDGNGRQSPGDLAPAQPLVCDVTGSGSQINIGPAIVSLLLGVVDPGTLAVDVQDSDRAITQPIQGRTSRVVNLKMSNAIAFAMPVSCSKAQDGEDLPIGLLPTVRALPVMWHGRVLSGEVIVRCRSIPIPPVPKVPQPPPPDDPVIIIPAKPHPAAIVQPPVPPAQPLANMNMNAGFSSQEEQQFQLAAVGQDASEHQEEVEGAEELAFSDYRQRDGAAGAAAMLGGAFMISAAAGVAYRRRLQRAHRVRTVRI
jgi:hypothetical protein